MKYNWVTTKAAAKVLRSGKPNQKKVQKLAKEFGEDPDEVWAEIQMALEEYENDS